MGRVLRINQTRSANILAGLMLILLALTFFLLWQNVENLAMEKDWVAHTYQVLAQTEDLLATIKAAESAQRGYLFTQQISYLTPFDAASISVNAKLDHLRLLTLDNSVQQQAIEKLLPLLTAKFAELQRTIDSAKRGDFEAARQMVLTNQGQTLMDQIDAVIQDMQAEENILLVNREQTAQQSVDITIRMTIFTTAIGFSLLILALIRLNRELVARCLAETALQTANGTLEQRVAERTHALMTAERHAVEQGELFRVTLSSIGDAVLTTDTDSRITFVNAIAERLTGWSRAEAIGQPIGEIFNIINEQSRQPVRNPVVQVIQKGVIVGLANHTVLIAKDGTEQPIDDSGAPIFDVDGKIIGAVLVFHDVTDQRQRQQHQELLADLSRVLVSELRAAEILNNVSQVIIPNLADWYSIALVDPAVSNPTIIQTVVVHHNPHKQHLARELQTNHKPLLDAPYGIGRAIRTGHPSFAPLITDEIMRQVAPDNAYYELLKELATKSNITMPLSARGRTLGAISFSRGDSGRTYTEADVALAEELAGRLALSLNNAMLYQEAQQAIHLRDEFLSIAAHELKTPITSLQGFAQLLMRRIDQMRVIDTDQLQHSLSNINMQSAKLTKLISQLLDIARLEAGRMTLDIEPFDLTALLRTVINTLQANTTRHALVLDAPDTLTILGDPIRLEQVIVNLLDNAIKYSPNGGDILIHLVDLPTEKGELVRLSVTDPGIGIPPDKRSFIFNRFYQAHGDGNFGGMGLGLYISRQIVELHDGRIVAEFPEGGGTRFIVTLSRRIHSSLGLDSSQL